MSIKNFGGIVHIGTYNDHHKEATFHVPPGTNTADLIRAFMSDKAEDVSFSSVKSESHSEKEPRLKLLFDDPQRTTEECNRFMNYITDHKLNQTPIDSSQDNPILKAVVCFCVKWRNLRYIEANYSPNAVVRFMFETCKLNKDSVEERAISNRLRDMLKKDYDKELYYDVCLYFN